MGEQSRDGARYVVPPVERAIRLLRYVGAGNTCRNSSAAAAELGINRTTLVRLVHTLLDAGMIEPIAAGAGYRLGPGLASLGAQALHGRDIVRVSGPILVELCARTGMSAHLGILDGRDVVYLSRETPNAHLVSNVRAGSRLPAHASSIGRAILAEMAAPEIAALLGSGPLASMTARTAATLDAVLDQAAADRRAGVAWSEGQFEAGIGSCAAVIRDEAGRPAGGLNVSGPLSSFASADAAAAAEIRAAVIEAGRAASRALGHSG